MMRSLQTRLGVGLSLSLLALFGLQWFVVGETIRYLVEESAASRLRRDSEVLLAALRISPAEGESVLDPARIDPIYQRPFSGFYYRITVGGRLLRSRSLWDEDLAMSSVGVGENLRSYVPGPQRQRVLMLASGFKKQDRVVTITVAEDLSAINLQIRQFQTRYGLVSLTILALLLLIQRLIVGRSLAPLEKVRRDLLALEQGETRRLGEDVPREVKPLIQQINRLLETMGQRLQRSRHALGNLAHSLKTPLTLLTQLADQEEVRDRPAIRRQLVEQTLALRNQLERELKRARLAGAGKPGQQIVLQPEIDQLFDALKKIYQEKRIQVECAIPATAVIAVDREDFLELLGNLLDNAFKWARGRIFVVIKLDGGLHIGVEDDGPGCPPEELERLTRRGVRVDESSVGHGLGLAIVKDIVEQYGGKIDFGKSDRLGGFRVSTVLPIPSRDQAFA